MGVPYRIRMLVPPELRVVGGYLRPADRARRRTIRAHLDLPATLRPAAHRPGSVWGVAMMRNEQDTARHVITHVLAQGVDSVLVADNGSTDATPDVLADLAGEHPVHVARDRLDAYAQGAKMTVLSHLAARAGADWIVPFDADELWFAAGMTVADRLRATEAEIVDATIHNVFPAPDDDLVEPDPFLRLGRIDLTAFPIHKVAFRSSRFFKVAEGNMDVSRRGRRSGGLYIAHYPWRTPAQLVGKLRQGRQALEGSGLDESMNIHWRVAGTWSDDRLAASWNDLVAGRAIDELSWSPVGPFADVAPGTWTRWELPAPAVHA